MKLSKILTTVLVALLLSLSTTVNAAIINVPADHVLISDAITAAAVGDTVLLAPGTYTQNAIEVTKVITIGSFFLTTGDPAHIASTIVDADNTNWAFWLYAVDPGVRVSGLTVINGNNAFNNGGGFHIENGASSVDHCVIQDCHSNGYGGGIRSNGVDLALNNVTISGCDADADGGGIAIQASAGRTITLDSVIIHHNTATWGGGVRILDAVTVNMNYVSIYDNTADFGGGINCYGAGIVLTMDHATVHGNVNNNGTGGGLRMWAATTVDIKNSIFDGNTPQNIVNQNVGTTATIAYTNITEGGGSITEGGGTFTYGAGMFSLNPLFVDSDAFDFNLQALSPMIDAGDPLSSPDPDATVADLGYYYFYQNPPLLANVIYPNGGENLTIGNTLNITWTASGGSGIDRTVISFSPDNGANWIEIDTTQGLHFDYDWKIPYQLGNYLIRIEVFDNDENMVLDQSTSFFVVGPMTITQWIAPGWSLISIPLIQPNMQKNAVIGDDLLGQWSLFGFHPDQGHTLTDTLRKGAGYFLGNHTGSWMDATGVPNLAPTHTFTLKKSWNIIGNPFHLPSPLADATVIAYNNHSSQTFTFADAVDEEVLSPVAYNYFDDRLPGSVVWPWLNNYQAYDTLQNWRGYWFMCYYDSVHLVLPNPEGVDLPFRDDEQVVTEDDWHLDFIAASDSAGDNARIGANASATAGFNNRFDYVEPNRRDVPNWIRMYFERSDWGNPNASKYNRDIRSPLESGEIQEWTLTIENSPATDIYLFWDELLESTPEMNSYTLIDPDNDTELDLRQGYVYQFHSEGMKQLTVRVKSAFVSVNPAPVASATEYGLSSLYPNPFNARTSISFNLPATADVKLSVFDLTGRKIADLFNSQAPAGSHTVNWNAQGFESGVYFVRFETPGLSQTKRIVLLK